MPQVAATSAQALDALGLPGQQNLMDKIESVVLGAQRAGARDLSMKEIQRGLELRYVNEKTGEPLFVEMSTISGRVNCLEAAGRLMRNRAEPRPCSITGQNIAPVSVPARQERLCY